MSFPINSWVLHVRDTTLKEGITLTLAEMIARFGKPEGNKPVANRMTEAARSGYFEKEGYGKRATYKPIAKEQGTGSILNAAQRKEFVKLYAQMGTRCIAHFPGLSKERAYAIACSLGAKAPRKTQAKAKNGKFVKAPEIRGAASSIWHLASLTAQAA